MSIVHTYDLDIVPGGVGVVVPLSQYDSDFQLVFNLFASTGTFTVENGTTATIRGTKLDGTGYSVDATLDVGNRRVTVTGDQQITAVAGAQTFELTLWRNSKQLNTANFTILVERAALDKDSPKSESVLRELVGYLDQAADIIAAGQQYESAEEAMREAASEASTAATAAQAAKTAAEGLVSQFNATYEADMADINREYTETIAMIKGVARETKDYLDAHFADLKTDYDDKLAIIKANLETAIENLDAACETDRLVLEHEYEIDLAILKAIAAEAKEDIQALYDAKIDDMNDVVQKVNRKGEQILAITTNAEEIASRALTTANNTDNHLGSIDSKMRELETAMANVSIDPDDLGLEQDPDTYYVYPTYKGMRSENGIPLVGGTGGGGGGGAETVKAILSVENTSGWLSKTIASGASVAVSFLWSSIEDDMPTGDGSVRITVNDVVRSTRQISQGNISIDLTPYISTGTNKVKIRISDIYDQGRTISFNITSLELSIESTFDTTNPYTGPFVFPYTPKGAIEKTVHFVIDGVERFNQITSVSNRQMSQSIPAQPHGGHSLLVYFDASINGELVRSNELYFEFVAVEALNDNVIITSNFNKTEVNQYSSVAIPFAVYNPASLTSEVQIFANDILVSTQTVDRTEQSYTYKANAAGALVIRIVSGGITKTISFNVKESDLDVEAETENLVLHLSAEGRSNNEETRAQWNFGSIEATLTDFTWRMDGWQTDEDDITVLRVADDARVTIPCQIFATDFKTTGKTIEIEFATRDVADYSAEIISCFANNIGLKITPQQILFRGAQTEISALYKDNEHIRLAIVVEKQNDNRLIMVYINGVMSGAVQYASGERFSQLNPVGITIGSEDCVVDIYNIRVYDNNLNRQQVVNNWIADTQNGPVMLERYSHNNVYDAYGNITIANLPGDLPYMIVEAEELPQYKGDKKADISGSYTDPLHPGKSFTFTGVEMDVQGTSSAVYYRKNYDMKFKQGFITSGGTIERYGLRTNSIPFNRFVLKADVASSESANNTELTMFYNDTCPYKTPEMVADPKVRWGIEGVPIVLFWHNKTTQEMNFMGKYNFNLPKRMPEPLGYSGDMESWEVERNNSANVKFQDNDFESQMWDEIKQTYYPSWYDDFEARFPSDEWRDYSKLNEFLSWVKSTWRTAATNENLESSVNYRVNTRRPADLYPSDNSYTVVEETSGGTKTGYFNFTFTKDTPAYRLTKFLAELPDYVEIQSATFYYLFTELFLMIDSRAKNMFVGFHGSDISDPDRIMDRKAVFEPYDMDTAIGTNNSGVLMFGYYLEDTDHVSSIISGGDSGGTDAPVYNAQDSVLWENFRDAFRASITAMYRELRTSGAWSYDAIESRFEDHQSKWPESIFNEDSYLKYIEPLVDPVTIDEATGQLVRTDRYLTMLQGSKEEQRKWWLWNRFRYLDSKYHIGGAIANTAFIRFFNSGTLRLTPAVDMYMGVSFGGGTTPVIKRATANNPVEYPYEMDSTVTEMETWIYSADLITDIGDISGFYPNEVTLTNATRLKRLQIGSNANGYSNANLNKLNVQNSTLLEYIDVRNCPNLATTINLSNANRLKEAYFDGTAITGVDLPDGGALETLHLPGTITALVLMNLNKLTDLTCPSYANVTRLMLANIDRDVIDPVDLLNDIPERSQINLKGLDCTMSTAAEIREFLALLDTMTGVSREKNSNDEWLYHEYPNCKTTVSGTIHIDSLTGAEYAEFTNPETGYPYIALDVTTLTSTLTYKSYDGTTLKTVTCRNGVPQEAAPSGPSKPSTDQYSYTFVGWSRSEDAETAESDATTDVKADRTVYPAYSKTIRTYTVTWKNADGTTLETDNNVPYDTMPHYDGATPTYQGQTSQGWTPAIAKVTGNVTYTASYIPMYTVTFKLAAEDGGTTLGTTKVQQGSNATYTGEAPTTTKGDAADWPFIGWNPSPVNIQEDTVCFAMFGSPIEVVEIVDSWETILRNVANGTYKDKYALGNYKLLEFPNNPNFTNDGQPLKMQIVGMDVDDLADGSGKAAITWISMETSTETGIHYSISSNGGGWPSFLARERLNDTIKSALPTEVANGIKEVIKYSCSNSPQNRDLESADFLWIPSMRELGFTTHETQGPVYSKVYNGTASRKKVKVGTETVVKWWTRSCEYNESHYIRYVHTNGDTGTESSKNGSGYYKVIGFCT